ncbi:MAG: SDR family NAD(P)-dependent oxidoreductase [Acidimicrobiia bacterium]|nr:SDR family NAD(P)-dependent oxidoreductase [Acidimicrobiia bacterium]
MGTGLEGRGGIVTGAASGIGRAVTISMAEAGARAAAIDRDEPGLRSTLSELPATVTCRWYRSLQHIVHTASGRVRGGRSRRRCGPSRTCSRYERSFVIAAPWSVCGVVVGCGAGSGVYGKDC